MSVELEIDGSNPWYLSPDIWVAPGNDLSSPRGILRARQASHVPSWVRTTEIDGVTPNIGSPLGRSFADPDNSLMHGLLQLRKQICRVTLNVALGQDEHLFHIDTVKKQRSVFFTLGDLA